MAPRWPQDGPKMAPRGSKMAPRKPKMAPTGPKTPPHQRWSPPCRPLGPPKRPPRPLKLDTWDPPKSTTSTGILHFFTFEAMSKQDLFFIRYRRYSARVVPKKDEESVRRQKDTALFLSLRRRVFTYCARVVQKNEPKSVRRQKDTVKGFIRL